MHYASFINPGLVTLNNFPILSFTLQWNQYEKTNINVAIFLILNQQINQKIFFVTTCVFPSKEKLQKVQIISTYYN